MNRLSNHGIWDEIQIQIKQELLTLYDILNGTSPAIDQHHFIFNDELLKNISLNKIKTVAPRIKEFRLLLTEAIEKEIDIFDTTSLLKFFLSKLDLHCEGDFLETLSKDHDIVEAFNLEHIQIFRNLNFMRLCSYSLADVLTYEWPDLFERSQVVTNSLIEKVMTVTTNKKTIPLETETHYMKERFSLTGRVHKVDFRFLGPLLDSDGNLAGYISSSRATIVDKSPDIHSLRFI